MPLYEYECDACGRRFEVIQKFSDAPVEVCKECGKGPVRRLFSSPAIQFKGSGWYITDYARKDASGASDADSKKAGDAGAKTDSSEKTEKSDKTATTSAAESSAKPTASPKAPADPEK